MEFGGYYLTICATLCLVFWTLFYRFFRFATRGAAALGGLKMLGIAYLVSAVSMAIGSWIETDFIQRAMNIRHQRMVTLYPS